uniref:Uncharacterized protein n=1 Tax=Candidatus Methanophagaceae archaeon ANME-1 ERB6 TaxID=2759912 RepID=A0A7G9YZM4_9EURY|nr:hypothetical protein HCHKDHBN_00029 [Methanosarcinales archaeon ANME-1 ERB6]
MEDDPANMEGAHKKRRLKIMLSFIFISVFF